MAKPVADFVLETANSPGTASVVNLLGAVAGRISFAAAFGTGVSVCYVIDDGTQAEAGLGLVTVGSPNTLTRTTVTSNTLGTTARLNFTGTVRVYSTLTAASTVIQDASGNITLTGATSDIYSAKYNGYIGDVVSALQTQVNNLSNGTVGVTSSLSTQLLALQVQVYYLNLGLIGSLKWFGGPDANIPTLHVIASGQALSRTAYALLFAAIGTLWGAGDGSTTFNVPDMRGRVPVGSDYQGYGSPAGRLTIGGSGVSPVAGSVGGDEHLAIHNHGVSDPGHNHGLSDPGHTHTTPAPQGYGIAAGPTNSYSGTNTQNPTSSRSTTGLTISPAGTGVSVQNAGGGGAGNVQPYAAGTFIMYAGV